jgi:hypothetical protein
MASLSSSNILFVGESSTWPTETYTTYLCSRAISPLIPFYQSENYYSFLKNNFTNSKQINSLSYNKTSALFFKEYNQWGLNVSSNNAYFTWDLANTRRTFDVGAQFNYFYINYTPETDLSYARYAAYLLYPTRLFLLPVKLTKENDGWTLSTSSVLVKSQKHYFDTANPERDAYLHHLSVKKTTPTFVPLPANASTSLVYNLSASYLRVNSPLLTYDGALPGQLLSRTPTPSIKSRILEDPTTSIRPDSTFFSYSFGYDVLDSELSPFPISQPFPGEDTIAFERFKSSYSVDLNQLSASSQTFYLVEDIFKNNFDPSNYFNPANSLLNVSVNLSSSFLQISSKYFSSQEGIFTAVSGVPFSFLGFTYRGESFYFFNGKTWLENFSYFKVNGSDSQLNAQIASTLIAPTTAGWKTTYPPHYYTYKSSVLAPSLNLNSKTDSNYLNFELKLSSFKINSSAVLITPYFGSEYDYLTYGLSSNCLSSEYFTLKAIDPGKWTYPQILDLEVLECFYGPNLDVPYNLKEEEFIPAISASKILISYPRTPYGEINLTLKASLTSDIGIIDTPEYTIVNLASGSKQSSSGTPIFLEKIKDEQGIFIVSCSHLTADPGFPTRDLTNTFINWSFEPEFIQAKMHTLDLSGNELVEIDPTAVLNFAEDSHTVKFSNLGLNTIVARLSSAKYNEIAYLPSDPTVFNPFKDRKFNIDILNPLDNFNRTRTLALSAGVLFDGTVYNVPSGTKVCWKWKFNNNYDPSVTPIKAYYEENGSKIAYEYGTGLDAILLSSIYLEITPGESNIFTYIPVDIFVENLSLDPLVRTSYSFSLDVFPGRRVLNSDFAVTYADYASANYTIGNPGTICNTAQNTFSVVRAASSSNIFYLEKSTELGGMSVDNANTTYVWAISDNAGNYNTVSSTSAVYGLDINATITSITLSAINALAPSWGITEDFLSKFPINYRHNLATTVIFYTPPASEFNNPLDFNLFPKFTWLADSNKVKILSADNFSLSQGNSAYDNRLSNTQSYWISANKIFPLYNVFYGSVKTFLSSVSSSVFELEIPVNSDFKNVSGLQIHLQGFNDIIYPNYSLNYVVPENGNLVTKVLQTTAATFSPLISSNVFKNNPTIIPYSGLPTLSFSLCTLSAALDFDRDILVKHTFSSSLTSLPIVPIDGTGTITYRLSSKYWQTFIEVPAVSGVTKLITLSIGDAYEPGYVSPNSVSLINVTPIEMTLKMGITPDTFSNYSSSEYSGERNLWNSLSVYNTVSAYSPQSFFAYTTAITPQLYIPDYITTVNSSFYIVYDTAGETPDNQIVLYKTYFDNSGKYVVSYKDEAVYYNFTAPGVYFIRYEIFYSNGQVVTGTFPEPVTVLEEWPHYYQEDIRTLNEDVLVLPYSLDQINIQPNEWGEADIFNTSITRLYECLTYLQGNSQSINTKFPTSVDGWLGANKNHKDRGISWYTKHFTGQEHLYPYEATINGQGLAVSEGVSFFTNILDLTTFEKYLFVLDDGNLKILLNDYYTPREIVFNNSSDFKTEFISANSICVGENINTLYVCDTPRNKIVRVDLDYNDLLFNFSLNVGSFGSLKEPNKFNSPTLVSYANNSVYVLDYNNRCVKEFSSDLNWIHTYYNSNFETERPLTFAVHSADHLKDLVYILTSGLNFYVLDKSSLTPVSVIPLPELKTFLSVIYGAYNPEEIVQQIIFEETGNFIYIKTKDYIFKYTLTGFYIGSLKLDYSIKTIKSYLNKNILATTNKSIVKMQDVTSLFKIGEGLPTNYWSLDQVLLKRDDFADDKSYNLSLLRMSQNIKMFRNILNSQFQKFIDPYSKTIYFGLVPISKLDQPTLHPDVEADSIKIAVNELHIPQVLNREFSKMYKSLAKLADFLTIKEAANTRTEGSGAYIECPEPFCWSWKATSSGNLNIPTVKICGINPITYTELDPNFPLNYAPGKKWSEAVSPCCNEIKVNKLE